MKKPAATLYLTLAVLLGSVEVSAIYYFSKGLDAALSGDFTTALREWKPLDENGDAVSQTFFGAMYANGEVVPKSYKSAV